MKKSIHLLFVSVLVITAYQAKAVWIARGGEHWMVLTALSHDKRPFVYRALIPLLSRALAWVTGLDVVSCMIFWVVLSVVGFYFAFLYLYLTFAPPSPRAQWLAFLTGEAIFLLVMSEMHPYDLATAMFFALALGLIARGHLLAYLVLFPIMTLNRETSFLMTLFWLVTSFRWPLPRRVFYGTVYQGGVYILIRLITMAAFADRPGAPFLWRPVQNVEAYLASPVGTAILLGAVSALLFTISRGWSRKPSLWRQAFLIIVPLQVLLQLTMGYPWEFRVYLESVPLLAVLAAMPLRPAVSAETVQLPQNSALEF